MTELDMEKLTNTKWHYFHKRFRTPFFTYITWEGLTKHYYKEITLPYEIDRFLYLDTELFADENSWQRVGQAVLKELEKNNIFLLNLMKHMYGLDKQIKALAVKMGRLKFGKISNQELSNYLNQYLQLNYRYSGLINLPLAIEEYMEKELKSAIEKKFTQDQDKIFQILTTPIKPSVIQKEERNLLGLAIKKSRGKNISKDISKHLYEFAWIKNISFDNNFFTRQEIEQRISHSQENNPAEKLRELENKTQAANRAFRNYQDQFKADRKTLHLINTLQEAIYFRSWRTERYYRNAYFMTPFFQYLAEQFKLDQTRDIFFLTAPEIMGWLKNNNRVEISEIKQRKEGYLMFADRNATTIYSGSVIQRVEKIILTKEELSDNQLNGMVAYPGKVSGLVCIVKTKAELDKVKEGNILITPSTTPDYVPVLKKVKAIITEEGGILSHASVISRELHIPCVIGTKIATKVLKDGDMVEVDADKGVVRLRGQ